MKREKGYVRISWRGQEAKLVAHGETKIAIKSIICALAAILDESRAPGKTDEDIAMAAFLQLQKELKEISGGDTANGKTGD